MARLRLPTLLETLFLAAAVAMGAFAVAPTVRRARDTARVDLAARSLRDCDAAVAHLLKVRAATNVADITLDMVEHDRRHSNRPMPVWPEGIDRASFDPTGTNGCTIRVTMTDGSSVIVTTASNRVEHAN